MGLYVKDIDKSNWNDCIKLVVTEEQASFLPSNLYSIAEAKFVEGIRLLGIYKDNTMIGFASYILDEEGDMNLYKFMIDKNYQNKGYGKQALSLVMDIIKSEAKKKEVWLSLHPQNTTAIHLYCNYGFTKTITGLEADDEIFFKYDF